MLLESKISYRTTDYALKCLTHICNALLLMPYLKHTWVCLQIFRTPILQAYFSLLFCTPTLQAYFTHLFRTPISHTYFAHLFHTPISHTYFAHLFCTPIMHTYYAHLFFTPICQRGSTEAPNRGILEMWIEYGHPCLQILSLGPKGTRNTWALLLQTWVHMSNCPRREPYCQSARTHHLLHQSGSFLNIWRSFDK